MSHEDVITHIKDTAMTTLATIGKKPETFWRRCLRKVAAFEEAMDVTYDDIQDRRLDKIELELSQLRLQLKSDRAPALP